MAHVVPEDPLKPRLRMPQLPAGARILRAAEVGRYFGAEGLLDRSREEAAAIVSRAQAHFDAEGRRGYEAGMARARAEAAERAAEHMARVHGHFMSLEARVVELATQAVRRIVAGFDDGERLVHVVHDALAVVRSQKEVTLRLNPIGVDVVKEQLKVLLANFPGVELVDVVGDSRVAPDACLVESAMGIVEADARQQLAAVEGALNAVKAAASAGRALP